MLLDEVAQRIGAIAVRIAAERELQENNRQLLLERMALQEANAALRTKEIAQMRSVSPATVNRHREHTRRKLKITNNHANFTTYLQSILSP